MKVCERCSVEIDTRDGDNMCAACDDVEHGLRAIAKSARRKEMDRAMRDLGLVKVRGALGGTYWE